MKIRKGKSYAVLTGDVIGSSHLSSKERRSLLKALKGTSTALRTSYRDSVPLDGSIFRGDGWQIVLSEPHLALRVALFFRAGLRARMGSHELDMRIAMAIGTINFVPGERVAEGDGEAFRLSGRALESMDKGSSMSCVFEGRPAWKDDTLIEAQLQALAVVVRLVDSLASRWSDKQALAVTGALRGWTQAKIAKECWSRPISQQAVNQHLDRAAWSGIENAVSFFEETSRAILKRRQVK